MPEPWPLVIVIGVALLAAVLAFAADRMWLPLARSTREWALVFPAGAFAAIAYLVGTLTEGAFWAIAAGNGAMVLAWGVAWNGCRVSHERRSLLSLILVASAVAVFGTVVTSPLGPVWAGTQVRLALLVALGIAGAVEVARGRLRTTASGRVGLVLFAVHAGFSLLRLLALLLLGDAGAAVELDASQRIAPGLELVSAVLGAAAVAALRLQAGPAVRRGSTERRVLRPRTFATALGDRVDGVLVLVGIAMFPRIRAAYGAPQARLLHLDLVQAALDAAPDGAIVGDLGRGRIALAVPATGLDRADRRRAAGDRLRVAIADAFAQTRRADETVLAVRTRSLVADRGDPAALDRLLAELDRLESVDEAEWSRPGRARTDPLLDDAVG